jgi:hypothetical protein
MGFVGGLMKAGLAKKAYDEARKPHNQRRIKDAISSIRGKGGSGRTPAPPR